MKQLRKGEERRQLTSIMSASLLFSPSCCRNCFCVSEKEEGDDANTSSPTKATNSSFARFLSCGVHFMVPDGCHFRGHVPAGETGLHNQSIRFPAQLYRNFTQTHYSQIHKTNQTNSLTLYTCGKNAAPHKLPQMSGVMETVAMVVDIRLHCQLR